MKRIHEPKVFVGPLEVAGYYGNLVLGLRAIGVKADFVEYQTHKFQYEKDDSPSILLRLINRCNRMRGRGWRSWGVRALFALPGELLRFVYFPYALYRYNVYIFGFGQTILPGNWDLPILRLLGKTVIAHLGHGSELRPPYINGAYQSHDGKVQPALKILAKLASQNAKRARFFEKNVELIIGAPFSSVHYTRRPLINSYMIGIPYLDKSGKTPEPIGNETMASSSFGVEVGKVIRILHCPSHPALKGTTKVRELIQTLQAKGHKLEYREIIGKPNVEVIAAIRECDFVIDQVYSDTPLSGFGTEAAWHGKAVVVGGYGFDLLKQHIPEPMWPPSKTCHPSDIEQAVLQLVVDQSERERVGQRLRDFVKTYWSAEEVAKRFLALIRGETVPSGWWLNPGDVVYFHGIGQTEEQTREKINALVNAYGVKGLKLSCKPALERACLAFAETGTGCA